jgi:hypothetical protein
MMRSSQRASRRAWRTAKVVSPLVLLALLAAPLARAADDPPEEEVFRDNRSDVLRGAATLAGAGCQGGHGTAMVLGLLQRGEQRHLWRLEASDKALLLSPGPLKRVKDSADVRIDDAAFEPEAYCEAVLKSSLVSLGAFANSARRDVSYADLRNEPARWRGDVIHYEGKLRRIHRLDAPLMLSGKGIHDLYECWVFGAELGANPVCLVCTELPKGVSPGEKLAIEVSFDAYFFKNYRYQAVDSKPGFAREAPLFIGRGFVITKEEAPASTGPDPFTAGTKTLLLIFLGGVLATFIFAFALHWWFRRGDRRVYARIKEARLHEQPDPGASGATGAEPSTNVRAGLPAAPAEPRGDTLITRTGPEAVD